MVALRGGGVRGFEASLRWPARPLAALAAGSLVHRNESSEVPASVGGWALAHACVEARYWPGCRVALNVSGRQFETDALLEQVDAALMMSGLAPERLDIELSEADGLAGASGTRSTLLALRERGLGLVLDDFGAGGASLMLLLRDLPLSAVKLDRCLVRELPLCPETAGIVRALVNAGHAMGLRVGADGVETLAQREFLRRAGCDEAQGSLWSRPLPSELLAALLDYGVDTCSEPRSTPETRDERTVPH